MRELLVDLLGELDIFCVIFIRTAVEGYNLLFIEVAGSGQE